MFVGKAWRIQRTLEPGHPLWPATTAVTGVTSPTVPATDDTGRVVKSKVGAQSLARRGLRDDQNC